MYSKCETGGLLAKAWRMAMAVVLEEQTDECEFAIGNWTRSLCAQAQHAKCVQRYLQFHKCKFEWWHNVRVIVYP